MVAPEDVGADPQIDVVEVGVHGGIDDEVKKPNSLFWASRWSSPRAGSARYLCLRETHERSRSPVNGLDAHRARSMKMLIASVSLGR